MALIETIRGEFIPDPADAGSYDVRVRALRALSTVDVLTDFDSILESAVTEAEKASISELFVWGQYRSIPYTTGEIAERIESVRALGGPLLGLLTLFAQHEPTQVDPAVLPLLGIEQ